MKIKRNFDLLELYRNEYSDKKDALVKKVEDEWIKYSAEDYVNLSNYVSYGLLKLGLKKGDKIATITNNRPEWNIMDMGMSQIGVIHVPVYPTLSYDDFSFIFNHSETSYVFLSGKLLLNKIKPIIKKTSCIKDYYLFDENKKNWSEIIELGKKYQGDYKEELENIKTSIKENDLLTIIYTSGTTGKPKGVMLSHKNIMSNALTTGSMLPLKSTHRALSFLPLCHVYERMMNYNFQYNGVSIYYAESLGKIASNIKEIKPDVFNTVPRLLERVYDTIIAKGKDLSGIKKRLFFWAVNIGLKYDFKKLDNWWYALRLKIANKIIFSKWREALGGNIKLIVSGGSTLQTRLQRVFWAAQMPVFEGYGLTETSPVIFVNDPTTTDNVMFGTVGPVLKGVEVKFADDGEILCKGPNVMLGYYKNEKLTNEVIDKDGWFHTGDIGVLLKNKFLKITDRKKEIFKISSGKYISPQVIETLFKESPLIEQLIVVGEGEKFASALISPDFNYLHFWAEKHKIHFQNNQELILNKDVIRKFQNEVNKFNRKLAQFEQIKRFRLVKETWSPETSELSQTLKLKRKYLKNKYENILREIYTYSENEKNRAVKE